MHLKGEESVLFEEHGDLEDVLQRKKSTTLQAWFESNTGDLEGKGTHLLYPDYCTEYSFAKGKWKQPDLLVPGSVLAIIIIILFFFFFWSAVDE